MSLPRAASAPVLLGATTGAAAAHSPLPGVEGFYSGLLHPLTDPGQSLAVLATGVLLGSFALRRLPPSFGALGLGLALGLAAGGTAADPAPWLFGLAASAAAAAALAPGRALPLAALAAFGAGTIFGWASVPDAGPARDRAFTMAGSAVGVSLLVLYVAGAIEVARERVGGPWIDIGLRIAAAWIAAVALLMLALAFVPSAS